MKNEEIQIKEMVVTKLEGAINGVNKIAEAYAVERVPLNMVFVILDKTKVNANKVDGNYKQKKAYKLFIGRFNDTITTTKTLCQQNSDVIGDGKMTPTHFAMIINHIKEVFVGQLETKES